MELRWLRERPRPSSRHDEHAGVAGGELEGGHGGVLS